MHNIGIEQDAQKKRAPLMPGVKSQIEREVIDE
jgi:hypothetical protein